ncbi:hypothetical protein FNH22_12810 [Fulvivirga sp. M361]|uniref:hypothetical protein n=1 Tax=Fulvivirga sp. M361 TaxID=2594266 RepID=UPI00117ABF07|nr:hypothetical protein [Fulvivirga sp. M361]TRX58751.1 hypothetical protein FNH22_12810 [Fulvivirga sp. M361]
MKIKFILSLFCCLLAFNQARPQEASTFYKVVGNDVKKETLKGIEESLNFSPDKKALGASLIIGTLLPHLIDLAPKLFYNPKKYMKESGVDVSLLKTAKANYEIQKFDAIKTITYEKMSGATTITRLDFKLSDIEHTVLKGSRAIELSNAVFNLTPVKLKAKHKKTNVIIEITLNYYDKDKKMHSFSLNPIELKNVTPGQAYTLKGKYIQIIPEMEAVENIKIKVTEVNSRKKDWDKWLEWYKGNKDDLEKIITDLIEK